MQGMTKKIPGPFAPPDLNRPSLMKPFLESNVLFNNPVILYTSQIKVRATPDHNHKFLPKDDCSLVLLNHLDHEEERDGERDHYEEQRADGHDERADARALLANCRKLS